MWGVYINCNFMWLAWGYVVHTSHSGVDTSFNGIQIFDGEQSHSHGVTVAPCDVVAASYMIIWLPVL